MQEQLSGQRVVILAEDDFEDIELLYPLHRFAEEGAKVVLVGPEKARYQGKRGGSVHTDLAAREAASQHFDAVIVPGGYAPDRMRRNRDVLEMVRRADGDGQVVAAICHGPWVLISAGVVRGRRMTGFHSIRDDLLNAGADFVDQTVVRDEHVVTSRIPADLGAFCRTIINALVGT